MEIKGKLILKEETKQITEKFKKRGFVVETKGDYPQKIMLELQQDNVDKLDNVKLNADVLCKIDIRGREWTNPQGEVKYFNTLVCWFISNADKTADEAPQTEVEPENDLPF